MPMRARRTIEFIDSTLPGVGSAIDGEDCSVRYFVSAVTDGASGDGEHQDRAILYAIEMTEQKGAREGKWRRARRCRQSVSSPGASRMTSTMC